MSELTEHGFTAVSRNLEVLLKPAKAALKGPKRLTVDQIEVPATPLAKAVQIFAEKELPTETFHHSMRIYYYGMVFVPYVKEFNFSPETYFISCLLHDIGTTEKRMKETLLSFEFHGGMVALELLRSYSAPQAQRDAVAEAIIRHQDIGSSGKITALGALLQLSTLIDNAGSYAEFVHEDLIKSVTGKWPRLNWTGCFVRVIRAETESKPWSHTTKLGEEFPQSVLNNKLMQPYD